MRIVALGRTRMLLDAITALHRQGHEIALVATCRAAPEYDVTEEDFRRVASDLGADFLLTQNLGAPEHVEMLAAARAEVAVSVNWVSLIRRRVCELFPFGILNAHAGDLPRYRGNATVAWAILNGEERVGITIHQMDPHELDAGPILLKEFYPLTERSYVGDVYEYLSRRVPEMFVAAVEGLARGEVVPQPQPSDPRLALRCYPRQPSDGQIRWADPALAICRLVRASGYPFPGAFSTYDGQRIVVHRARSQEWDVPSLAVPGQVLWRDPGTQEVGIATGDGVVVLEEVGMGDSDPAPPATVIRSVRVRMGLDASRATGTALRPGMLGGDRPVVPAGYG